MLILIVASTEMEIAPFLAEYPQADYFITGVGAPITIYKLTKQLHLKIYDCIIQVGIAGAYHQVFQLGDAVLVERDCFADLGVVENKIFYSVFEMGFAAAEDFPFKAEWLVNEKISNFDINAKSVKGATVNLLFDQHQLPIENKKKLAADIETMEGAAFHYVALAEDISFLQIRGISNYVGERDKSKWAIQKAVESSNQVLLQLYPKLIQK